MTMRHHLKTALKAGFLAGTLVGLVNMIYIFFAAPLYEWFIFYQAFGLSVLFFLLLFLLLFLPVQAFLFLRAWRSSPTKPGEVVYFYYLSAVFALLFFFGFLFLGFEYYLFELRIRSEKIPLLGFSFFLFFLYGLVYWKRVGFGRYFFPLSKLFFLSVTFLLVSLGSDFYLMKGPIPALSPRQRIKEGLSREGEKPNLVLITLDTVGARHLSFYGSGKETTPHLEELSGKSVLFENAFAPSSWTLPSHASLFTGQYPSNRDSDYLDVLLLEREKTLAEILKEGGYQTAGFVGNPMCKGVQGLKQGFLTYKDRIAYMEADQFAWIPTFFLLNGLYSFYFRSDIPFNHNRLINVKRSAEKINRDIFSWLKKNKRSPFFLFINYDDAHDPYTSGMEYVKKFSPSLLQLDELQPAYLLHHQRQEKGFINFDGSWKSMGGISSKMVEDLKVYYGAGLYYLDLQLKRLFEFLETNHLDENTIVIITSDHGEEFFEHRGFDHGLTLYQEVLHVPLLIYYPEKFKPARIEKSVKMIDLFSTILDLLKFKIPSGIDSRSLLPLIAGGDFRESDPLIAEIYHPTSGVLRSIQKGEWKLIAFDPPRKPFKPELFHLALDPKEENNLYQMELAKRVELEGELASGIRHLGSLRSSKKQGNLLQDR